LQYDRSRIKGSITVYSPISIFVFLPIFCWLLWRESNVLPLFTENLLACIPCFFVLKANNAAIQRVSLFLCIISLLASLIAFQYLPENYLNLRIFQVLPGIGLLIASRNLSSDYKYNKFGPAGKNLGLIFIVYSLIFSLEPVNQSIPVEIQVFLLIFFILSFQTWDSYADAKKQVKTQLLGQENLNLAQYYFNQVSKVFSRDDYVDHIYQDLAKRSLSLTAFKGVALFLNSKYNSEAFTLVAGEGLMHFPKTLFFFKNQDADFQPSSSIGEDFLLYPSAFKALREEAKDLSGSFSSENELWNYSILPLVHEHKSLGFLFLNTQNTAETELRLQILKKHYLKNFVLTIHHLQSWSLSSHRVVAESELHFSQLIHRLCLKQANYYAEGPNAAASIKHAGNAASHSDYAELIKRKDGSILGIISDTAGSGLEAALATFLIRTVFQMFSNSDRNPAEVLTWINLAICNKLKLDRYASSTVFLWNPEKHSLSYSSAGPAKGFFTQTGTQFQNSLNGDQAVLGMDPRIRYEGFSVPLEAGDILCLFTDGLTDLQGKNGLSYGLGNLMNRVREYQQQTVQQILKLMEDDIVRFLEEADHETEDEYSLLLVKIS